MPFQVSEASPHEVMPALRVLHGTAPGSRAETDQDAIPLFDHDERGLLVARDVSGRICGAILVQVTSGSLGVSWVPRGESSEIEDNLVVAAGEWLRDRGVKVCQAFASREELPALAALARNGFRRITQLVFMRCDLTRHLASLFRVLEESGETQQVNVPVSQPSFTFTSEVPPFSPEFQATALATHEGTLDCPEMSNARTPGELLAGFADEPPSARWHLANRDGVPVGVVVCSRGVDSTICELSYVGVVPAARGSGAGEELLKFAISEALLDRALTMTLAVDDRNEPALRLYRRLGFEVTERRDVLLALWGG